YEYTVILGDPGSGKSTLLQYILLNWMEKPTPIVPLLIELRKYIQDRNAPKDFLDFFHQGSGVIYRLNKFQLHEQLLSGNAFVMFDGLDEVFDPQIRSTVITEIIRFTNEYPKVRVIVTSRIVGYLARPLENAGFRHLTLQDLDPEQINKFIKQWYDLAFGNNPDKQRLIERLQTAIDNSPAICELASNPLLLTMMAILNRHQELPRDRPELYEQASRVLLHNWDIERGLPPSSKLAPDTITRREKQAILRQVAYFMQSAPQGLGVNLIHADDLEEILTNYLLTLKEVDKPRTVARLIIEQLRTRSFILSFYDAENYAFVHRTFLEFFCAWEFVWRFKEKQTLSIEDLKREVFVKHIQDESWHEVLRLISGMIDETFTAQIIEYLIEQEDKEEHRNILLAAECLFEVRNRFNIRETDKRLLNYLKNLINDRTYEFPYQGISAIATTWRDDPQTLPWLKNLVNDSGYSLLRSEAVEAIAKGWKNEPDTLPGLKKLAKSFEDDEVRIQAVRELVRNWKYDPEVLKIIELIVKTDEDNSVREVSIVGLAHLRKNDPEILSILKALIGSNEDKRIRRGALRGLVEAGKDDSQTLTILKNLVNSDDDGSVRSVAIREIAQHCKNHPETAALLKSLAKYDNDLQVKYAAVEQLVLGCKNDPETLIILKNFIESIEPGVSRRVFSLSVRKLVQEWKNDPETLPWLKYLVLSSKSEYVRDVAIRQIAREWKNYPETLPWLKNIALFSDDSFARGAALCAWAQNWKNDPEILPILLDLVKSSHDEIIKLRVLVALANYYKLDLKNLSIIKNIVQFDTFFHVRLQALIILAGDYKDDRETLTIIKNCAQFDKSWEVRTQAIKELAEYWKMT
ncbi:MAG: NACHT domain-containing protein, partial [Calothrix sp. SM1_7_51]|nr:NACHT domain-containing protein [Calothrix sp. SM1_7_51]